MACVCVCKVGGSLFLSHVFWGMVGRADDGLMAVRLLKQYFIHFRTMGG